MKYLIRTERLGLRNWQDEDEPAFAELCAHPEVMEFFPATLNRMQSADLIQRFKIHYHDHGYTYFAVDRLDTDEFIGFIGLMHQTYESPFSPFVDIGWRLKPSAWGNGFATEGAQACIRFGFDTLKLDEIYAVAPERNVKSQAVMQKIGMTYATRFKHPKLKESDRLNPCVVYKIGKEI